MEEKSKHDVHKIQQYFFFRGVPILRHFMSIEVQNSFYPFTTHCGILSSRQDFLLNKKKNILQQKMEINFSHISQYCMMNLFQVICIEKKYPRII